MDIDHNGCWRRGRRFLHFLVVPQKIAVIWEISFPFLLFISFLTAHSSLVDVELVMKEKLAKLLQWNYEKSLKNSCSGFIINSLPFAANLSFLLLPFSILFLVRRFYTLHRCLFYSKSFIFMLLIYIRRHSHFSFTLTGCLQACVLLADGFEVFIKLWKSSQVIRRRESLFMGFLLFPNAKIMIVMP